MPTSFSALFPSSAPLYSLYLSIQSSLDTTGTGAAVTGKGVGAGPRTGKQQLWPAHLPGMRPCAGAIRADGTAGGDTRWALGGTRWRGRLRRHQRLNTGKTLHMRHVVSTFRKAASVAFRPSRDLLAAAAFNAFSHLHHPEEHGSAWYGCPQRESNIEQHACG